MRKQNDTQKLLQSIYIKNNCKSMEEAWTIYRQMYEDVELEPREFKTKPVQGTARER
jgi:hypothetical protein